MTVYIENIYWNFGCCKKTTICPLFDNNFQVCYNRYMMKTRKRRTDRNHLIYFIQNVTTGDSYIGLTALAFNGNVKRTLTRRMQKHLQRALAEDKAWGLCESLRTYGPESFVFGHLETVRGKGPAHVRELELIRATNPTLNTFI